MSLRFLLLLAAALSCGACSSRAVQPQSASLQTQSIDWRDIATINDRARLRQWRSAWVRGLTRAQAGGHGAALAREGALVQPDAAIDWQTPPPGAYRCRTIKIGARSERLLDYVAYPYFDCRVRIENGVISLAKLTGSQRPLGLLFPDAGERMVFLGTLQLGDERSALQYGRDRERDLAGIVERVGDRRWRIVFPLPHFESLVDIIELVPVSPEPRP